MRVVALAIALFCAAALSAQPVISNLQVKSSHGSVRVQADITNSSGQSLLQLHYGITPALGYTTANAAHGSASPGRYIMEAGLAPQTTYFFRIKVTASTGTTWLSCSPGSSGPGWACDDASGIPVFTTAPLPSNHGEPDLPAPLDTTMPVVNGETFNVAESCSNLQSMLNACAAADTSLVHQVMIPPGAVCTGSYTLPAKIGSGTCIVRSSAPDSALPPEGVQISDEYASAMPLFQHTLSLSQSSKLSVAANAQGWRLTALRFAPEPPLATYKKIAITNVGMDGVVTTATPHGLTNGQTISVYGVTGFNGRGPNGTWYVYSAINATQFKLGESSYGTVGVLALSCAAPPCYAGGGYMLLRTGNAISGVSETAPPVITTSLDHGLINEPWSTITSASGATLTLANGHFIDGHITPVEITGSSVAAYNGIWNRNGITGNNLTLTDGPSGSSCSFDCGRVRIKRALHIQGVEGAITVNGNHFFTVVDDTHIQIDDAVAGGTYAGGGIVSQDPDIYRFDLSVDPNASRIVIDRVMLKGASEWPNRQYAGISLSSSQSAIVDSRVEGIKMWNAIDPKNGLWEYSVWGAREAFAIFISSGNMQKIHNTFIECQGICVFAEEASTPTKTDFTFTRNYMYNSPVDMAGGPQSNGLYYRRRQHFELKQGRRFLIDGNTFDGGWVDAVPAAAALLFTPRAWAQPSQQHLISDITITNNTIRNSCSGIQISGQDETDKPIGFLTSRFKIKNNLFYDLDCYRFTSKPSLTEYTVVQGYALVLFGATEDITFDHNTALDGRGRQPAAIQFLYGKHEGLRITNNLLTHNHQNGAGLLGANGQFGNTPTPSGTAKQIWDGVTSNSTFSQNVLIPGVRNTASDSSYDSTSSSVTFTQPACAAYYAGFTDSICLGSPAGNDTATQRHSAVGFYDPVHRDLKLRYDSPAKAGSRMDGLDAGADINILESVQGKVRNVRLETGANSATLSYMAPDGAACFIDYVTDPGNSIPTRISDGGGAVLRTVSLPDLTAGTLYHYRLQCASEQPRGSFVTEQ